MLYDIYAGGINALDVALTIDFNEKGRYEGILSAHTFGFLGALVPWEGSFESYGWMVTPTDLRPELHKSVSSWRDETEIKEYSYNKDRSFNGLFIKDHGKPRRKEDTKDELTHGTTDVIAATLIVLQRIAEGQNCASESEIFDGKRRYILKFNHAKNEELKSSRYNVFEGTAQKCTAEVIPKGGAWHKKPRGWMSIQEQGRDQGMMPTIWFAQLEQNAPAIPVKIYVKTAYGSLLMHLTSYQSAEKNLIAEEHLEP